MSMNDSLRQTNNPSDGQSDGIAQWIPEWFPENHPDQNSNHGSESPNTVFAVILHDDDEHTCRDFVELLEQVFGYTEPAAYVLTQEIAKSGRTVVWKGLRDDAERKAQQARTYQPRWRMGTSITAPQRVNESVPPCTITVELASHAARSHVAR